MLILSTLFITFFSALFWFLNVRTYRNLVLELANPPPPPKLKCAHSFKIIDQAKVFSNTNTQIPVGTKYTQKCEHCGEMRYYKNY